MRITIEEVLACPKGMSIEEYHLLLEKQEKRNKRLRRLSQERDFLLDGLAVLSDEVGSDRYQKKWKRLQKVKAEIERLQPKLLGNNINSVHIDQL